MASLVSGSIEQEINKGACFIILQGSESSSDIAARIPCYPETISESQSSNWATQNIIDRSAPISAYNSTEYRDVSVSFTIHRELGEQLNLGEDCLERLEAVIRRTVYPSYNTGHGVAPPITTLVLGKFKAKGYVTSISFQWKGPIRDGLYQMADIQIQMRDTAGGNNKVKGMGDVMPGSIANGVAQQYTENPFAYTATWSGSNAINYK